MSKATALTLVLLLLPVAQVTYTAGIAGSQGPRECAVHFTLDFPQSGTDGKAMQLVGDPRSCEIPGRFLPMSALIRSACLDYTIFPED